MFGRNVFLGAGCLAFLLLLAQASFGKNELFQVPQIYDSGAGFASSIAMGDVNGDGVPDLLVADLCNGCQSFEAVGVLLGKGDGTFQPARIYPSGNWGTESIAVADVNEDGQLDVIVGNAEGSVGVLLGKGDGTFQSVRTYPSGGKPSFGLANWMSVADVNGDGHLDVLVANECPTGGCNPSEGVIGVLLGRGDGTLQAVQTFDSGGSYAESIAVADVNEDGKPDLLVTNRCLSSNGCPRGGDSGVSVFVGKGDGTFVAAQSYDGGGLAASSIAVGDVNEDGKLDLLVGFECGVGPRGCGLSSVGVLMGNGDGTFMSARSYDSGGGELRSIAVADVNEDGHLDLITTNFCNVKLLGCLEKPERPSIVGVLLGNGDGTFQPAQQYSAGSQGAVSTTVGDVNGDGAPDLFVANGTVVVLLGRLPTTTHVNSSLNPSVYGQPVTFAATVSSGGPKTPTGTVTFRNGSKSIGNATLSSGVAILTTKVLAAGTWSITATYKGAPEWITSTSAPLTQVVSQASTKTTIKSSMNPSAQGQPVTFTAKVTSPTTRATGTVTFTAGTTTLGIIPLSGGTAILTTTALPQGANAITSTYDGNENVMGSTASLTQIVN